MIKKRGIWFRFLVKLHVLKRSGDFSDLIVDLPSHKQEYEMMFFLRLVFRRFWDRSLLKRMSESDKNLYFQKLSVVLKILNIFWWLWSAEKFEKGQLILNSKSCQLRRRTKQYKCNKPDWCFQTSLFLPNSKWDQSSPAHPNSMSEQEGWKKLFNLFIGIAFWKKYRGYFLNFWFCELSGAGTVLFPPSSRLLRWASARTLRRNFKIWGREPPVPLWMD